MEKDQNKKQQCPEFPHFGASYPDARCIDGYLWDLDSDEDGFFTHGGDDPCPFCNREEYMEWIIDPLNGVTKERVEAHLKFIDEKYNS